MSGAASPFTERLYDAVRARREWKMTLSSLSPARSRRTAGLRTSQKATDIDERASLIPETNLPLRTFQPTPASAFGGMIQDASSSSSIDHPRFLLVIVWEALY